MHPSFRTSWMALLAALVLVPLAVGVVPVSGMPLALNVFVKAKLVVLCITAGIGLAAWALARRKTRETYVGLALVPVGAFVVVAAISAAFGLDPRIAIFGDFEQGTGLIAIIACAIVLVLVTQLVRSEARLREMTTAVVLTATGVAAIGILQQVLLVDLTGVYGGNNAIEWMVRRGFGTIGNPDTYAAYLVLPGILALGRLASAVTSKERALWGGSAAAILASLVLSQTRGPLVGLLAGGVVLAALRFASAKRREGAKRPARPAASRPLLIGVTAGAVAIGLAAAAASAQFAQLWSRLANPAELASLGGRLPLWRSALEIAAKHPVLGVGPDTFRLAWYPTRTIANLKDGAGLVITDPHNVVLHLAATIGVLGLIAFGVLVIVPLVQGYRSDARKLLGEYDTWMAATLGLLVTMLSSMFAIVLVFMLFVALGVLIAPSLHRPAGRGAGRGTGLVIVSLAIATALVAFSGATAAAGFVATGTATDDTRRAASRAEQAVAIAPWDTQLRVLRGETVANAALDAIFTGKPDALDLVSAADDVLGRMQAAEPQEYIHYYRRSILLIGAGPVLGADYTSRGTKVALDALSIYPNGLELRTGLATGLLQLDDADAAQAVLDDVWDASPTYPEAGRVYVRALLAQGLKPRAIAALDVLDTRFPGDEALATLRQQAAE